MFNCEWHRVQHINSDYYASMVLQSVLANGNLSNSKLIVLLEIAEHIGSDDHLGSEALTDAAPKSSRRLKP